MVQFRIGHVAHRSDRAECANARMRDRGTPRARRRRRVRDADRRARQGRLGAALPRRRHRGHRRPGAVRERLGAADRRQLHPRARAGRALQPPVHTGDVRVDVQAAVAMLAPAFGFGQTYDISDEQAREDIGRLAVMVLSYAAQSARGLHQAVVPQSVVDEGADPGGEVPDPLEGRGRPQARQGDRRLLVLGRRARHERLDLHRPRDHLDRRRRGRGVLRRHRRDERSAARRRPARACSA